MRGSLTHADDLECHGGVSNELRGTVPALCGSNYWPADFIEGGSSASAMKTSMLTRFVIQGFTEKFPESTGCMAVCACTCDVLFIHYIACFANKCREGALPPRFGVLRSRAANSGPKPKLLSRLSKALGKELYRPGLGGLYLQVLRSRAANSGPKPKLLSRLSKALGIYLFESCVAGLRARAHTCLLPQSDSNFYRGHSFPDLGSDAAMEDPRSPVMPGSKYLSYHWAVSTFVANTRPLLDVISDESNHVLWEENVFPLFSMSTLLQNIPYCHWTLLVCRLKEKYREFYDSLKGGRHRSNLPNLVRTLYEEASKALPKVIIN
ncbi:hypothetical protein KSP39_PZI022359 [Platanthera zijinensis]|uniref:Uncharacterized protein n=1 Tax=Platanthera zijinensis TaxID=2320716 RepID=A0AAP0AW20_9ASPA